MHSKSGPCHFCIENKGSEVSNQLHCVYGPPNSSVTSFADEL